MRKITKNIHAKTTRRSELSSHNNGESFSSFRFRVIFFVISLVDSNRLSLWLIMKTFLTSFASWCWSSFVLNENYLKYVALHDSWAELRWTVRKTRARVILEWKTNRFTGFLLIRCRMRFLVRTWWFVRLHSQKNIFLKLIFTIAEENFRLRYTVFTQAKVECSFFASGSWYSYEPRPNMSSSLSQENKKKKKNTI